MRQDINTILQAQTWDLSQVCFDNVPVMQMNLRQIQDICRSYGFTNFLTEAKAQAKLAKTAKELGVYTIGVSLAPFTLGNQIEVCSNATPSCKGNCVVWYSGNPAYISGKQNAMTKRKEMLADNPALFLAVFMRLIQLKSSYALRHGLVLSCRFNISSDIKYEQVQVRFDGEEMSFAELASDFMSGTWVNAKQDLPVMPYDYTKHFDRPSNAKYHLVYSVTDNDPDKIQQAIDNGLSLAVVFDTPRNKDLPNVYQIGKFKLPVIDGDKHDYLPEHSDKQVIVGLRFKYQAKHKADQRKKVLDKAILSGFVKIAS